MAIMKIEKVSYQKSYPIGPFLQEKISFEASVDGDSPEEVISRLRKMADDWHTANNPHIADDQVGPYGGTITIPAINAPNTTVVQQKSEPVESRIATIAKDIESCTELKVLESYRLLAKTKPEWKFIYDKRLKELTNG
jgi:hypothetical protein